MKHVLKGAAVMVGVIIVNMIVHVICNMNGVDLNTTVMGTVSAVCAMFVYDELIKNEKNKDDRDGR